MTFESSAGRRLLWSLGALALLALGAAIFLGLIVFYAETTTGPFGGMMPGQVFAVAVTMPVFGFGVCVGMAFVPRAVAERRRSRDFAAAMGLAAVGLVFFLPTPLFCLSAPLGALAVAGAIALFRRSRRPV